MNAGDIILSMAAIILVGTSVIVWKDIRDQRADAQVVRDEPDAPLPESREVTRDA